MFKKFFALMLCAVMCVTLTACGGADKNETADNSSADAAAVVTAEPVVTPEPFDPIDWETVEANPVSDFTYQVLTDDYVQIDSYIGTNPVMRIPAEIDGVPVCGVAVDAFRENTTITHAYMPDSLTVLEDRCFLGCTSLKQVRLSDDMYMIRSAVFKGCSELRVINMPAGLNSVDSSAFSGCASLTEAVFTENLHSVKDNAFEDCVSLAKFSAPGLTWLAQMVFVGCTSLSDMTLFAGCSSINGNSFNGCTSLQSINLSPIPEDYEYGYLIYENGVLYLAYPGGDSVEAVRMFPGTPVEEVVLRADTKEILHSAFYGCQLKSIVIPARVREIEGNAFKQCPNLESVTLEAGSNLEYVSGYVFEKCYVLKNVDFSGTDKEITIADSAFFLDEALEKVALPANMSCSEPLTEVFKYSTNIVVTHNGVDYAYDQLGNVPITIYEY